MRNWRDKFNTPSRLDEFVAFRSGQDWKGEPYTDEMYCKYLLRMNPTSPKMEAGTLMHEVIEISGYNEIPDKFSYKGWNVYVDSDIELLIPASREIKLVKELPNGAIINGKVDAMSRLAIHDYKFTGSVDLEKYIDSWQWKAYLIMAGLQIFVYDVFNVKVDADDKVINVKDYDRLELYSYKEMAKQLTELIDDYYYVLSTLHEQLVTMSITNNLDNIFTRN